MRLSHGAKGDAALGRGRRRHSRDIQHAARRRALRHRNPAAGNFQPHLPAGRHRHRRGDLYRTHCFSARGPHSRRRRSRLRPPPLAHGRADFLIIALLGVGCGLAAFAFIRLLALFEDWFPTLPGGVYAQAALGMAAIGAMMVGFTRFYGHPFVNGVGYGAIQSVLDGRMTAPIAADPALRRETAGHLDQPGFRRLGRRVFAAAVHRLDAWRRLGARRSRDRAAQRPVPGFLRHRSAWPRWSARRQAAS